MKTGQIFFMASSSHSEGHFTTKFHWAKCGPRAVKCPSTCFSLGFSCCPFHCTALVFRNQKGKDLYCPGVRVVESKQERESNPVPSCCETAVQITVPPGGRRLQTPFPLRWFLGWFHASSFVLPVSTDKEPVHGPKNWFQADPSSMLF